MGVGRRGAARPQHHGDQQCDRHEYGGGGTIEDEHDGYSQWLGAKVPLNEREKNRTKANSLSVPALQCRPWTSCRPCAYSPVSPRTAPSPAPAVPSTCRAPWPAITWPSSKSTSA